MATLATEIMALGPMGENFQKMGLVDMIQSAGRLLLDREVVLALNDVRVSRGDLEAARAVVSHQVV